MASGSENGEINMMEQVQSWIFSHVLDNHDYVALGPLKVLVLDGKGKFPFSLHLFALIIGVLFLFYLFLVRYNRDTSKAPTGITNFLESIVLFVRNDICIEYIGEADGRRLAPWFLTFFFTIITLNLMGLIPGFTTVTGNLMFTAALGVVVFFFMTVYVVWRNGPMGWFSAFVPHGVPKIILLLVTPLEILGVAIKSLVLALRLFANLLAGHLVLFNMIGLMVVFGVAAAPAIFLALFVFFLEILVSCLQAYIFTMLAALFVAQVLHPEH